MEDLIEVIFVFIAIGASIISSASKAKKRRKAEAARQAASPVKRTSAVPKSSHPYAAAQPTVMPPLAFSDIPDQVVTPAVHPHVQPDCITHDAPGSLGVISAEGKDPCHEEQLTHARTFAEPVQEEVGMTFDWSGENMVKAFVMQEVLTRPASQLPQRRAR